MSHAIHRQAASPLRKKRPWQRDPSLSLKIEKQTLRFRNVADFAFALQSRKTLPNQRYAALYDSTAEELQRESDGIRGTERQLTGILEEVLANDAMCGPLITRVGSQFFSKDHSWRTIIEQLSGLGPEHELYRRVALTKYLQYLDSRQEAIQTVFSLKSPLFNRDGATRSCQTSSDFDAKETISFDLKDVPALNPEYLCLPRGETLLLNIPTGQCLTVFLANFRFKFNYHQGWQVTVPNGTRFHLQAGKNSIGRSRSNDILVDGDLRKISRIHLTVETVDANSLLFTDSSSHGTYVPIANTVAR